MIVWTNPPQKPTKIESSCDKITDIQSYHVFQGASGPVGPEGRIGPVGKPVGFTCG